MEHCFTQQRFSYPNIIFTIISTEEECLVNFDLFYRPVKTRFRKHCETTGLEIDRHHVLWLDIILIMGGCLCNVSAQDKENM